MEQAANIFRSLSEYIVPAAVLAGVFLAGLVIRRIVFSRLQHWSRNTQTQLDDIVISSVRGPAIVWFFILGITIALRYTSIPDETVAVIDRVLLVLAGLSITFVLANLAARLIGAYGAKVESGLPVTSLTQHAARIVIVTVGILVILNMLGISITPILATLGIGGLAVALALQDTLANLFAGFHIIVAKQIRVGDYVKLESGEEGYITDINWRTTRIRMLANNVVLVPNDKLAKAIVTNHNLPDAEVSVLVQVGVHYRSDLARVEEVTIDVARSVMREVPGGIPEFDPFIRYHTFADSSIQFSVILRARQFVDNFIIKHEFIKRLHLRYEREGIVIPFPIRALNYDQEKSGAASWGAGPRDVPERSEEA